VRPGSRFTSEHAAPPQVEPDETQATVIAGVTELVDAGLGTWLKRMDGLREFHGIEGKRWLFLPHDVKRLA
jgi:hypothetical protein